MRQEYITGYALSMYQIATSKAQVSLFKKEAQKFLWLIQENKKLMQILNSYQVDYEIKINFINKVFEKHLLKYFINLSLILIKKYKFHLLVLILQKLITILNQKLKIENGVVYSVIALKENQIQAITQKINKQFKTNVELINKIDYQLIGGIKVVIGNKTYDDSVLSKLQSLQLELNSRGVFNGD